MADDNLQVNQNTAAAPTVAVTGNDDVFDLDSIYDLDATSVKPQATLSANAPVPAEQLQGFRAQSGAVVADGAVDSKVLSDLMARAPSAATSAVPVAPVAPVAPVVPVAPVAPAASASPAPVSAVEPDEVLIDADWLKKLSADAKDKPAEAPVAPLPMQTIDDSFELEPTEKTVIKPVSEAQKIEADLEANIVDLDADLADDVKPAEVPSALPKLSKVQVGKSGEAPEQRVVAPLKLSKTDTIYKKSDKKDSDLSVAYSDKKLTGPIEELSGMTLENWKRLGDIPAERVGKIKEKIAALGAKSIIDEINGLNAWRRSPTHQAYLDLGIAGMQTDEALEELIAGQDLLTTEEWLSINQLNRELMI